MPATKSQSVHSSNFTNLDLWIVFSPFQKAPFNPSLSESTRLPKVIGTGKHHRVLLQCSVPSNKLLDKTGLAGPLASLMKSHITYQAFEIVPRGHVSVRGPISKTYWVGVAPRSKWCQCGQRQPSTVTTLMPDIGENGRLTLPMERARRSCTARRCSSFRWYDRKRIAWHDHASR